MVVPEWDSVQCFDFSWILGYPREVLRQLHCPQLNFIQQQRLSWPSTLCNCLYRKINAWDPTTPWWTISPCYAWYGGVERREKLLGGFCVINGGFDLYILAVALIPNNAIHYSNYNADLLQKRLKETFKLEISQFTKSVASGTTDSATAVARFFSPRAVQVNYGML